MKKILLAVLCTTSISAYALTDDEKNNIGKERILPVQILQGIQLKSQM